MKNFSAGRRSGWALAVAGALLSMQAGAVTLAPVLAGQFQAGSGVDAQFLKVPDSWQQSTVLWNEGLQQFGSGVAVSSYAWGTGLWGLADWQTANVSPTPGMIESSWSGRVAEISFGDDIYNSLYAGTWGSVALAPLFTSGGSAASQDNWSSSFGGYIRISEAGNYNFSVLHDDGFFFQLNGAGGQTLGLANDFLNPREALGFDTDLQLAAGLYSFELGAYDRLQAGVVELSWSRNGGTFTRVPTGHLVGFGDVTPVPEPGTWALLLSGLLGLSAMASRRRKTRR